MKLPLLSPRLLALGAGLFALHANAQVTLVNTSYTQNFNSIGSGLPEGWSVRTSATASALGSVANLTTATTAWGTTTGNFRNVASTTGLVADSNSTAQHASANRALGVRQTDSFGDPGAAFVFNFNSTGYSLTSLSFDSLLLTLQVKSTEWTIDYGLGTTPTSFTSLGTFDDPGAWGATSRSITGSSLAALSNQSSVWLRVVALNATTGGGARDTFAIDNFNLTYAAVPEPATSAAVIGALALLGIVIHRRRQAKSSSP